MTNFEGHCSSTFGVALMCQTACTNNFNSWFMILESMQEISDYEHHSNRKLCDNGNGRQTAGSDWSHQTCSQQQQHFVSLTYLQQLSGIFPLCEKPRIEIRGGLISLVGWLISSLHQPNYPGSSMHEVSLCHACPL